MQRSTGVDLEALEEAVKNAALKAGAGVLEELLEPVGAGRREEPLRCPCGAIMKSRGARTRSIRTLLGEVGFSRSVYGCPACGRTRRPGDEELGVQGTRYSPGVRRQTARLGAKEPFAEVSEDLRELAGIRVARKDCERISEATGRDMEDWMARERLALRYCEPPPPGTPKTLDTLYIEFDGTGVPMVPHELAGRKGKQQDGSAKTREVKLGCVFTQTAFDEDGRPVRDPASTTFTGGIEAAAPFGWRIYSEAVRRGLFKAKRIVVLTDGALWIQNLVQTHFPGALHIIDLYHAREHLVDLCRLLFDRDLKRLNLHKDRWWELLDQGQIEALVEQARACLPRDPGACKEASTTIAYFEHNKDRMRYARFKAEGLFVGSGVIEAACKSLIGKRLKQSAMEWTVRGANAIAALRCVTHSNRFEDYWENRAP